MTSTETRLTSGFTLIEILVAIAIFAIVIAVVSMGLLQLVQNQSNSRAQIGAGMSAQQIAEQVRAAWQNPADYRRNCVTDLTLPSNLTLTSQAMQFSLVSNTVTPVTGSTAVSVLRCTTASTEDNPVPTMRRLSLSSTQGSRNTALVIDVLNPEALP